MKTKSAAVWRVLALAGLASLSVPAMAMTGMSRPAEQHQGSVGYITGGIGEGQAKLFERRLTSYPLAIELLEQAGKREEFTADAIVKITDRHGHTVLDAQAGGPFMLVRLAPGRYSIQATLGGDTLKKSAIWVANGKTTRATFEFPAGTDDRLRVKVSSAAFESAPHSADWLNAGMGG